jgi:hypothetical protein
MNYIIKMMSGDSFKISEQTFAKLEGKTGLVHFRELNAILNLNSVVSIVNEQLANSSLTRKQNKDGQWCIDKFKQNDWRLENNPEVKVDLSYYPELVNKYDSDLKKISNPQLN